MDDLRIVVAGLQGGTAAGRSIKAQAKAGKQWKGIQNTNIKAKNQGITEGGLTTKKATLKGLEDTTITKGKGKKAKTSTVTNEVSKDLELKFTDKDIQKFNSLKGESAKNEFIAGKLKTDHNFTTTPEQTNSLMDAFALPKDKVLGFRGKGITQKGKIKGETKTPELTTRQAYKQVSQGFSPRKSTRATRTEAINATQPTANFALNRRAVTGSKKYPFLGPTKLWTVGQSPWRTIGITRMGQESNRALERDRVRTNLYQAYKDGGRISKFQPGGRTRLEDMNAISDWGNVLSDFGSRHYEQADLDILNAQHRARLGMGNTMRGANVGTFQTAFNNPLLSGIIGHVAGTTGYGQTAKGAYNSAQNGNYNVDNRVGGVTRSWIAGSEALQKYFSGPEALNRTSTNIIFDPKAENGQGAYRFMDSGIDGVGTDENPIDAGEVVVTAQGPKKAAAEVAPDASKQGGMGDLFKGGFARLGKLGIDPDNAMAIGSLAMALGHNNRQANVMKKGINTAMGALESSPFEIYPRFTDYGITAHYENAAQQQLGVKPATSDYLMSHAIEQDAKNKAEQLRLEGRMKVSELYSNYQDRTDDLRRNYAGMRTDVANRNRQRLAQLNMALAENEAGRLANQYTSWNNFIMEKRDRLAQDKAKNENFSNMLLRSQLAQDQQKAYSDALKVDQDQFNLLEEAERNKYRGVEDWLQRTNAGRYLELQNEYNKINEDILKKYGNSNMDYHTVGNKYPKWRGINNLFNPFVSRYASGGKTKAKSKSLNAAEQI